MSHQIEPLGHNGNLLLGETFRRTNQTNAYVWASHEESQKGWKKKSFDLHCEYAKRTHNITIIILYTRCLKHPVIKPRCLIFGLTCDGFAEWLLRVSLQKVMLHVVQGLLQEIKWLLVASSNILVLLYGPVSTSGKRSFIINKTSKISWTPPLWRRGWFTWRLRNIIFKGPIHQVWVFRVRPKGTPPKN